MAKRKIQKFDGIKQCAAAKGIDPEVLLWAKKQNAPGFPIGSRVHWGPELEKWLEKNGHKFKGSGTAEEKALKCEKLREQIRGIKQKNDVDAGMFRPTSEFDTWAALKDSQFKEEIHRAVKPFLLSLCGLTEPMLVAKAEALEVVIMEAFRKPVGFKCSG